MNHIYKLVLIAVLAVLPACTQTAPSKEQALDPTTTIDQTVTDTDRATLFTNGILMLHPAYDKSDLMQLSYLVCKMYGNEWSDEDVVSVRNRITSMFEDSDHATFLLRMSCEL